MTGVVVLVSALAVVVMMAATAAWARRSDRWAVVDTTWGLGFGVIAVLAALVGDGDALRRVLLLALPAIWAGRLASHIIGRAKEAVGAATGADSLRDEGREQQNKAAAQDDVREKENELAVAKQKARDAEAREQEHRPD